MHRPIQWVRNIFYVILAVIGVPVNLVSIVILSKGNCGLSSCTTRYLVAMSTADLLVIITEIILQRINDYYFPLNFLDLTFVCRSLYVLIRAAIDCSVWFTIAFTFDRFVAICCQKLQSKYYTRKTAIVVLATISILLCIKNTPIYFRYKPRRIIDNVEWRCSNKRSYFTDPRWIGFRMFEKALTPLLPFILILLLNALTFRHILVTSRVRQRLRGQSKKDNHRDSEMERRRKSLILLFTISGSFIFLWLVYVLYIFRIDHFLDDDSYYIFENVAYMLRNLSCCTNTFIYVAIQSEFREQLKSAVKRYNVSNSPILKHRTPVSSGDHGAEDAVDSMFSEQMAASAEKRCLSTRRTYIKQIGEKIFENRHWELEVQQQLRQRQINWRNEMNTTCWRVTVVTE
ncbi:probable G-protein coupled receptor 139 [Heterodontus francisci]|uniref:probable G-protein coupled receptor 139 n=1 Tax=Heterodontus francisci TaxID=7792 RepID=UPI00355C59DB